MKRSSNMMSRLNILVCPLRHFFVLALIFAVFTVSAATNFVYVATNGNDAWSGTLASVSGTNGPKASLQGARDAVRAYLAQTYKWPTVVQIADGTYALTNTLTLTNTLDSASATNAVVYQATPGASPVFSGGQKFGGWSPAANGRWTAFVPGAASDTNYFEQLFVDGRRATRALSPNTDYYYVQATDLVLTNQAFGGQATDVALLGALTSTELSNVAVVVYHKWSTSRLRLSSFNASSNWLTFTAAARYVFNVGDRYQLENLPAALDQPGEWFLARDGTLTYWPLPGEDINTAEVIAPRNSSLIQITGDPANGLFVQNLTFRGLSFQHGQYLLPPAGVSLSQAVPTLPAVITLNGARNIVFTNCEVAHIGQNAIGLQRGCQNCVVARSYLHDLGGGGVYIGETSQQANLNNRTTANTVDNCIIRAGGRIHASGVGVWIGNSSSNSVTRNEISDLFYSGVSAGWTWGYGTSIANNNHIDGNHIHDLGWGVLSDMGAVYTLGFSPGTTVNGNYIHHISRYSYGGWGLYTDEGSSGILMSSNLVHDTQDGGFHQNYGETNTIQNNIFAHGLNAELRRTKNETNRVSFAFQNNIVYWPSGALLDGTWSAATNFLMASNLYWQVSSPNISFAGNTLAQWQALGQDAGSRIADPLFQDGMNRDFRFASSNAVAAVGFRPFDFTQAGVYGDAAWRAKAQLPSQPDSLPQPVSFVPFDFNEDFEGLVVGATIPHAAVSGAVDGASVMVVSNAPANGTRCLAVTDALGLAQSFYPYFYYTPSALSGSLNYSFNLRLAADTRMYHEWRDDNSGTYLVGPSVRFEDLQIKVGSSVLATVPSDQWLHVEIYVNSTNYAGQGWRLGLTKPGQATQWWTNYPSGNNTNWNQLGWLGWVSSATNATSTYYLDDLTMTNPPSTYLVTSPQPPAPVISGLTNYAIAKNSTAGPMAFTVVDPAMTANLLALNVSSSNPRLVPAGGIVLGGSGTNRTLTLTSATNQTGVATITVLADNGTFQTAQSFDLTVTSGPRTFYVATNGSDSYTAVQATSLATPWKTIQKAAGTVVAGDTVLIRGGTYRETVTPTNSGTSSLPIVFMPYNSEAVTISGAEVVGGWNVYSNGIYQATFTGALGDKDQVFVDGVMMNQARWPNTSLDVSRPVKAVAESASYVTNLNADGTVTGAYTNALLKQASGSLTGAKIHLVPGVVWVAQTGYVTTNTPGSVEFHWKRNGTTNTYMPKSGDPFYLFGLLSLLDTPGEWFINTNSSALYLWPPQNDSPTNHLVEAKKRDYGFDLSGKSDIQIQGLRFFACAVNSSATSQRLMLDGLDCSYVSHFSLIDTAGPWSYHMEDTGLLLRGTNNTLRNSHIAFSAGNGVTVLGVSNLVDNCVIHGVDYADLDCAAINTGNPSSTSFGHEIRYNTCYDSARGLMLIRSLAGGKVHHNVLYRSMLRTTDGGALYSFAHDGQGTEIAYNRVSDNMCSGGGSGIYLDNQSTNFVVHHNLIYNSGWGLHYNLHSINMRWFNNTAVAFQNGFSGGFSAGRSQAGGEVRNNICTGAFVIATTNLAEVTVSNNLTNNVNPLFVSTNQLDFRVQSNSPAVDAGFAVSPYTDGYSGTTPDIGAFEYGQPAWTAGATIAAAPPAAPTGLTSSLSGSGVQLSWQDNSTNEPFFVIDRSVDNWVYSELVYLPPNTTNYTDAAVVTNNSYFYRVRAGASPNSNYRLSAGSGHDAFAIIQAELLDAQSGLTVGSGIGSCDNNDWAKYANVDFGAGATNGTASVAVPALYAGQKVEFRLDSTAGSVIGVLIVADTGSFGTYSNQVFTVTNATGVHDLYLVFKGGSGVCNMDYFYFNAVSPVAVTPVPQAVAAAFIASNQVLVTWALTNGSQAGFKIERSTDNQNYYEIGTAAANTNAFTDVAAPVGINCYYRVRSYNRKGFSDYSLCVLAISWASLQLPAAPSNLNAGTISSSQINLIWTDNATNETGFKLERKTGAGGTYAQIGTTGVGITNYSDSGLTAGTQYYYRVRATNNIGDSAYSNETNATTQAVAGAPFTIFTNQIPTGQTNNTTDGGGLELGTRWRSSQSGSITGLRYYRCINDPLQHTLKLWDPSISTNSPQATVSTSGDSGSGWKNWNLATSFAIVSNRMYVVTYDVRWTNSATFYSSSVNLLANSVSNGPLSTVVGTNGCYALIAGNNNAVGTYPTLTYLSSCYFADVLFQLAPVADVLLQNTGPATVLSGATYTNTITVTNAGPSSATSVVVLDTLPNGLQVTNTIAVLAAGGVTNILVSYTAPASGSLTNRVASTAGTYDSNPGNNTNIIVVTTVTPVADIQVTNLAPTSLVAGMTYTNIISVTNAGPSTATNVVVLDFRADGTSVTNVIAVLAAGGLTNFSIISTVTGAGPLTNVVSALAGTYDPDLGNNTNAAVTMPLPPASPASLKATEISAAEIQLNWAASSGAGSYNIKRAGLSGGPYTYVITGLTATNYSNGGLATGTSYYYVVSAVNSAGEGANSTEALATTWTGLQQWRFNNWGTTNNTGAAADYASPGGDGIPNLLKYALGLNPLLPATNGLPTGALTNGFLTLTYNKYKAATDITCTAEVSSNLIGPWLSGTNDVEQLWQISDGINVQTITARDKAPVPTASSRFMRLKVSQP
ncbi:MAG: carbohydrate-binding protein [Verrucomicrobiota bacterium]